EPIDELYERFSKPRIPLDEPEGAAEHAPAAATTAPPAAESAPQGAAEDPFAHEATSESDAPDTAGAVEDEGAKDGPSQAQALVASAAAVADHAAEHDHDHADEGAVAVADAEDEPAQAHDGAHLSTPSAASADPQTGAATELPDWADQPTLVVGNVRRVTVEAGPYSTLRECTAELHREIDRAVHERVKMLVYAHLHRRAYVPELEWLPLEPDFALRECMTDHHVQHNETTMGRFMTCWALLEFTPEHDERLLAAWKAYARRDGIATTLVISLVVLSIVGGVWLLLKLDTWTRGYYSKRLFLGVPAVIIVLLLLAAAA
ncbi:MAG TPA: hypothetical protein VEQ85_14470, partial [Lacipirellulaceae bacterium]|nr:hypothetical protein [Lacipirellulaceae bacterium]